jgi:phosphatidylglycerol lysyltransferase
MTAAAGSGSSYLTLGLSPLSFRAPASNPNPVWMRTMLGWIRAHGRRFYNFQGLEAFKAKFVPDRWDPIVAITNESRPSLGTLHAIADAFSGPRSPERLFGRAVFDAAGEELRTLSRKFRRSARVSS